MDGEIEEQRRKVNSLKSHIYEAAETRFEPRELGSKVLCHPIEPEKDLE